MRIYKRTEITVFDMVSCGSPLLISFMYQLLFSKKSIKQLTKYEQAWEMMRT